MPKQRNAKIAAREHQTLSMSLYLSASLHVRARALTLASVCLSVCCNRGDKVGHCAHEERQHYNCCCCCSTTFSLFFLCIARNPFLRHLFFSQTTFCCSVSFISLARPRSMWFMTTSSSAGCSREFYTHPTEQHNSVLNWRQYRIHGNVTCRDTFLFCDVKLSSATTQLNIVTTKFHFRCIFTSIACKNIRLKIHLSNGMFGLTVALTTSEWAKIVVHSMKHTLADIWGKLNSIDSALAVSKWCGVLAHARWAQELEQ